LETGFVDDICWSEVRKLSREKMWKLVFDLKQEMNTFMEGKGNPIAEFKHEKWTCEFDSAVDITTQRNESNIRLQGKDSFINSVSDHVKDFEIKLPSLAITGAKQ
jgi:hypothetical protein